MSACILWIDSEHANIFHVTAEGVEKNSVELSMVKHSNSHQDEHRRQAEEHFFHNVAKAIGDVGELLVFGPGLARTHFKNHLDRHHHEALAKRVIGVEPLDSLTDNQVLEAGRKFFKKYNLFNFSI